VGGADRFTFLLRVPCVSELRFSVLADAAAPNDHRHLSEASPWVRRFAPLIPAGGRVLDLACGGGRHARYLAGLGYAVDAVDRDGTALAGLAGVARVTTRVADLENAPWPYAGHRYAGSSSSTTCTGAVSASACGARCCGGADLRDVRGRQREFGRPANPDFLLEPGELLELARDSLRVVAYEDIFVPGPKPAMMQRICAVSASLALDRAGA